MEVEKEITLDMIKDKLVDWVPKFKTDNSYELQETRELDENILEENKKNQKKLEETSSLGSGFRSLIQKFYPRRMWDPSFTTTTTSLNSNGVESVSKPEQKEERMEEIDNRPARDLSNDIAMRMSGQ